MISAGDLIMIDFINIKSFYKSKKFKVQLYLTKDHYSKKFGYTQTY